MLSFILNLKHMWPQRLIDFIVWKVGAKEIGTFRVHANHYKNYFRWMKYMFKEKMWDLNKENMTLI